MLSKRIKGKVLFIFSDPGGAKPCLALSDNVDKGNREVVSDRSYHFYEIFNSNVTLLKNINNLSNYIYKVKPDVIFTGTSYTSSIEKKAVKIAKINNIRVISFVDHYTSISSRFSYNNEAPIFPDEVWVIDDKAKKIAIEEGINDGLLFVSGNPYHEWLKNWKPQINREDFYLKLGLTLNKKYVIFAPDPLSNVNGIEKFNFDEYVASKKILQYVDNAPKEFRENYHFLIKAHPNQSIPELKEIFRNNENFTFLPLDIDVNLSLFFSDIAIGFFSSILLEAMIMDKPVIRFLEDFYKNDPFKDKDVGVISSANLILDILKYTKNKN